MNKDPMFPIEEWDSPQKYADAGVVGYEPMTAKELDTEDKQDEALADSNNYLEEKFDGLGVEMCYVMLTNIVKEDTDLLCFGEKAREVILSAFQLPSDMEDIVLKGLVSRKKQLIPSIVTVLQQM